MTVGTLAFLFKLSLVSRAFFLAFVPFSIFMVTARQLGTRTFLQYVRSQGQNIRRVAVLVDPERVAEFSRFIEQEGGPGYEIVRLPDSWDGNRTRSLDTQIDEAFLTLGDSGKA